MRYRPSAIALAVSFFAVNAFADPCVTFRNDLLEVIGAKKDGSPSATTKETKKVGAEVESIRNAYATVQAKLGAIDKSADPEAGKNFDRKSQQLKIMKDFNWVAAKDLLPAEVDSFTATEIPILAGPWHVVVPERVALTMAGKSDELLSIRVANANLVDERGYLDVGRVKTSVDFEGKGTACRVKNFTINSWDLDLRTSDEFQMSVTAETCQAAFGKKPLAEKATRPQIAAAARALFVGDDVYRVKFGYSESSYRETPKLLEDINSELSFRTTVCKRFGKYVGGPDFSNPVGPTKSAPTGNSKRVPPGTSSKTKPGN